MTAGNVRHFQIHCSYHSCTHCREFKGPGGFACISSNVVYVRGGKNKGTRGASSFAMMGGQSPAPFGTPSRTGYGGHAANGFANMPQSPNMGGPMPVMAGGYGGGSGGYGGGRGGFGGGRGGGPSGGRRLTAGQRVDISKGPYKYAPAPKFFSIKDTVYSNLRYM